MKGRKALGMFCWASAAKVSRSREKDHRQGIPDHHAGSHRLIIKKKMELSNKRGEGEIKKGIRHEGEAQNPDNVGGEMGLNPNRYPMENR